MWQNPTAFPTLMLCPLILHFTARHPWTISRSHADRVPEIRNSHFIKFFQRIPIQCQPTYRSSIRFQCFPDFFAIFNMQLGLLLLISTILSGQENLFFLLPTPIYALALGRKNRWVWIDSNDKGYNHKAVASSLGTLGTIKGSSIIPHVLFIVKLDQCHKSLSFKILWSS